MLYRLIKTKDAVALQGVHGNGQGWNARSNALNQSHDVFNSIGNASMGCVAIIIKNFLRYWWTRQVLSTPSTRRGAADGKLLKIEPGAPMDGLLHPPGLILARV